MKALTNNRPFRYYQYIKPPVGETYTVLCHNIPQADIDILVGKIRPHIEKWRDKLRLSNEAMHALAWTIAILRSTELMQESKHEEVILHLELHRAHMLIDDAVQNLSVLELELSLLIDFHGKYKSSAADVFEKLRSVIADYDKAKRPSWGRWSRGAAWHQDAKQLKALLQLHNSTELRTGQRVGFAKEDAPAIKFIHWALEEKRTTEAIVGALRFRRSEAKRPMV
jgi:hypothetical protein